MRLKTSSIRIAHPWLIGKTDSSRFWSGTLKNQKTVLFISGAFTYIIFDVTWRGKFDLRIYIQTKFRKYAHKITRSKMTVMVHAITFFQHNIHRHLRFWEYIYGKPSSTFDQISFSSETTKRTKLEHAIPSIRIQLETIWRVRKCSSQRLSKFIRRFSHFDSYSSIWFVKNMGSPPVLNTDWNRWWS